MKLLSVEAARARMLARAPAPGAEDAPLGEALGRVLAADVLARRDQPPFTAAAMDGWAVRAEDGAGPRRIVGQSAAGHGFDGVLRAGEAVRIFTGAPAPRGADAVIIQEEARRAGNLVVVPAVTEPRHLRPAGQDFRTGDRLLKAGVRLDPWRLALAAAAGAPTVRVARRPRLALLATGDEIVEPGEAAGPLQIFNSGTTALRALAAQWGAQTIVARPATDDLAAIRAAVGDLPCDLLVTVGGASVGDHDLVKPALEALGLDLRVESIDVRPGKPTWFGVLGDGRLVLGLPGNPASALVCAELFLAPLLRAMQGAPPGPMTHRAASARPLPANGRREHWMRAILSTGEDGRLLVDPLADQDSSLVRVFEQANTLIRRPAHVAALAAGALVDVLPLARSL